MRRGSYDEYDHSDEELYVYDQCCGNCRYFDGEFCNRPYHLVDEWRNRSDWCEYWKNKRSRTGYGGRY